LVAPAAGRREGLSVSSTIFEVSAIRSGVLFCAGLERFSQPRPLEVL